MSNTTTREAYLESRVRNVKNDLDEIGGDKIYSSFLALLWRPTKAPSDLLSIFKFKDK